jgi:hypothetical protein
MVATTAAVVVLVAMKDAILPEPLAASPIDGVLLVQLNTTLLPPFPPLGLVNAMAVDGEPLHSTWLAIAFTVAVGFTVMVNVVGIPAQLNPFTKVGVTVMVATTGAVVVLIAMKVGKLPIPFAARPIDGALFVQLYMIVPPVAGLLNATDAVDDPLHNTWLATAFTVAIGLTVMVNVIGKPLHPFGDVGVTVIVAVVVLVNVFDVTNDGILPVPFAANPIDGLLFTQL